MQRETMVWTILFLGGAGFLAVQSATSPRGVGQQYVVPIEITGQVDSSGKIVPVADTQATESADTRRSIRYDKASPDEAKAVWSPSRTIGVWVAAFLTLAVFSYLYRDNLFYKLAESIVVGTSAGYYFVMYFWSVIIDKVVLKVAPDVARYAFLPDTPVDAKVDYIPLIPLVLGSLVFCRFVPRIAWLGRWPLAFVVGTTAGLKLITFMNADFVQQIRSTILPLIVFVSNDSGSQINFWQSFQNTLFVLSVLSSLTYFYFSVEHKGIVGRVSRAGVWVLMISFGASFAFTVMGRITLLTMRIQFLFDDWLGLVKI